MSINRRPRNNKYKDIILYTAKKKKSFEQLSKDLELFDLQKILQKHLAGDVGSDIVRLKQDNKKLQKKNRKLVKDNQAIREEIKAFEEENKQLRERYARFDILDFGD